MIVTLEGPQGTGKSITASALLHEDFVTLGRKVIANVHLGFPSTFFDLAYFLKHLEDEELYNCDMWLDEMYQILDSRTSAGKINKLLTYFIVQTRKRGVDLYVCTHHISHVDVRLRRAVDVRGTCNYIDETPCKRCGGTGIYEGTGSPDAPCDIWGKAFENPYTCGRCLGVKARYEDVTCTGVAITTFFDRRARSRWNRVKTVQVPMPKYSSLYDTEERIAFTNKQKNVNLEDL